MLKKKRTSLLIIFWIFSSDSPWSLNSVIMMANFSRACSTMSVSGISTSMMLRIESSSALRRQHKRRFFILFYFIFCFHHVTLVAGRAHIATRLIFTLHAPTTLNKQTSVGDEAYHRSSSRLSTRIPSAIQPVLRTPFPHFQSMSQFPDTCVAIHHTKLPSPLHLLGGCRPLYPTSPFLPHPFNHWLFLPVPGVALSSPAFFHDGLLHLRRQLLQSKVLPDTLGELLVHLGHATFLQRVRVKRHGNKARHGREGKGNEHVSQRIRAEQAAPRVQTVISRSHHEHRFLLPMDLDHCVGLRVFGSFFYGACCAA